MPVSTTRPGSLKARLCVEGAERLYAFCEAGVSRTSVAASWSSRPTPRRLPGSKPCCAAASANGVTGLELVDAAFVRGARAARTRGGGALVAGSGRVEAEALVRRLLEQAAGRRAQPAARLPADRGNRDRGRLPADARARGDLRAHGRQRGRSLRRRGFRSWAGRRSPSTRAAASTPSSTVAATWVHGLVYPLPHPSGHGLGVHLTRTTGGAVMLGPTIRYQERKDDYENDRLPVEAFLEPTRSSCRR